MYLVSDFSTELSDLIYELQIIKLIKEKNELSEACKVFYNDFIEECLNDDQTYCLYSYINHKSNNFENFQLDYYQYQACCEFQLSLKGDAYDFVAYDLYLSTFIEDYNENCEIHSLLDEITGGFYEDLQSYKFFEDRKPLMYEFEQIEYDSFYIGPFYIEGTIQQLVELDKLISERKFMFKLKNLHRKSPAFAGLFLYIIS